MLFIQWKENVVTRFLHVLKVGHHTHESHVCEWAFFLIATTYEVCVMKRVCAVSKKHIISEELGYYSNDSVAITKLLTWLDVHVHFWT